MVSALCSLPSALCAQAPKAQGQITFDSARAYDHLRQIVSIGPRPSGSPAIAKARDYVTAQLKAIGVTVTQQAFTAKTPIGQIPMVNLIATIPGTRKERIAIAGHYDTKLFREFRFVGANDGGSSTALLIELARVLKSRTNTFTIELIFFDGEEATLRDWGANDHTYGSQYYVDAARKSGTLSALKALVLVDMIADRSPRFLREQTSTAWLTDIVWSTAQKLGHGALFVNEAMPIEDDHVPFLKAGVAATDIIDLDYAPWHTEADTLDQTSARTMQVVGDVVVAALAPIEARLRSGI
ncbi:MAG TPA: M28 family peptidase [Vicinamibacterales bacterium]|nr:M28 family peptidase [Vicinamibacterales bacterium]